VGGYLKDDLTKFGNNNIDFFANFLFTQIFRASVPENVCRLISHKDQTRLTMDEAYQILYTEDCVEMDKRTSIKSTLIHAVSEEQNSVTQDPEVAAFRLQQRQQKPHNNQQNFNNCGNRSRGHDFSRGNFNNRPSNQNQGGSNASRNGKFCVYCKIMNHAQQECRKKN
jgi:hypothetical protein